MTKIDQFESVFKAAAKERFRVEEVEVESAMFICDLDADRSLDLGETLRGGLAPLRGFQKTRWRDLHGGDLSAGSLQTIEGLLALLDKERPDLICTHRSLCSSAWRHRSSLGAYVEVLTQSTAYPILLLPHPRKPGKFEAACERIETVMAMTDHLSGDHSLVNWAVAMSPKEGELILAGIEDAVTFERYMNAISKIPSIDTDEARKTILAQLLKDSRDYAKSAKICIQEHDPELRVEATIAVGRRLADYRSLVAEKSVDLLVLHTKDDDQAAMHGLAYPLAVEIDEIPLLLL